MPPTPQESEKQYVQNENIHLSLSGLDIHEETIVISGMSGLYPQSHNVKELSEILYRKINPVKKTSRWKCCHPDSVNIIGEMPQMDTFDSQFFKINHLMADAIDPMGRKLMEQAYQALFDAGLSPAHLSNQKVGVYMAVNYSEAEKTRSLEFSRTKGGRSIAAASRAKLANRISYWLNATGPSVAMDAGSCGSIVALEKAYNDIKIGRCDAALVGGCNMFMHPQGPCHFGRIFKLSKDGKAKAFDKTADGSALSDAINVLFLQKARFALRVYAVVLHVKTDFLPNEKQEPLKKDGFIQASEKRIHFLNKFYEEINIAPELVEYIEAFGTGIAETDKTELEVISQVFCKRRNQPLLVGSVISNIGFSDASSGISGITKVLLGYQNGVLAGNLNCVTPRDDIPALQENLMRILTDHHPFHQSLAAINGTCYTRMNSHVLLNGYYKNKYISRYESAIPYLVTISGRNESAVRKILNDLKSRQIDPEELALLHNIHEKRIIGHLSRGFSILGLNEQHETVSFQENIVHFDDLQRPLWFVYSGMGSQWVGMGAHLMKIPVFASSIKRCHEILKSKGIDLINIITSSDKNIFDNILNSFVGIAAIQVALTDVLRELGLVPDKIIGHSVGEIGCAYADNCLTAEEMMLAAYCRGTASNRTPLIKGAMAAVGMGFKQMVSMCPSGIYVACHNGPHSCTLSGPAEDMSKFIAYLTSKNIFTREVPCANIAYHSKYISDAGPWMLSNLKEIIKTPKLRSSRWLSTSVPQGKWNEPYAKFSSAEYFTNNLLSPVLFEEILTMVPPNAVLVEIAPHGLLQAILKSSLPETCLNIPLTKRGNAETAFFLLKSIGNIYNAGYELNIKNIYPKVEFPVSTGTPMLSHLVEWFHEEKWSIPRYDIEARKKLASCRFPISLSEENNYLEGHIVEGKSLYPFAGALVAVWDTFAMCTGVMKKKLSVKYSDIQFYSQPMIHKQQELKLRVTIQRGSGYFEVLKDNIITVKGYISALTEKFHEPKTFLQNNLEEMNLKSEHIYQLLRERDYSYNGDFCSIYRSNPTFSAAELIWNGNWVTLIDGMIQLNILKQKHDSVSQLTYINSLIIDLENHADKIINSNGNLLATYSSEAQEIRCGGLLLKISKFIDIPSTKQNFFLEYLSSSDDDKAVQIKNLQESDYLPVKAHAAIESNLVLKTTEIGNFDALKWVETSQTSGPGLYVKVYFAGINNYDVTIANGTTTHTKEERAVKNSFGMDFSGVIASTGERVMGVVYSGTVSRELRVQTELLWPVPAHWSLEEAATIPLPYIHAYYCLCIKYQLSREKRILVVGGTGGLGQAIISIALSIGCEVFAAVNGLRKKQFLRKLFPELKVDNIFNSLDDDLSDKVITKTKGRRCDLVINCIKGSFRKSALKCCSKYGSTIDVVQIHSQENYELRMAYLRDNKSYAAVNLTSLLNNNKTVDLKKLQQLVSKGICNGYVRPLTRVTYSPSEVPRAFRLLTQRRHCGRVLLNLREPFPMVLPRLMCSADRYHWIICDDEDFCLMWAEKLITCGARKLIINCPNTSIIFDLKIRNWKKNGTKIKICKEILKAADVEDFGTLEGVYIVALKTTAQEVAKIANDLVSHCLRKLRISNKYFAIVSSDNVKQQTFLTKAQLQLPTTFLQITALKEFQGANNTIYDMPKRRGAIYAIEQALLSNKPVLRARYQNMKENFQLQRLSVSLGIDISNENDDSLTLKELGVQFDKLQEISSILHKSHSMYMSEAEIASFTIKQLRALEKSAVTLDSKVQKGLASFFSFVDPDEISATAQMTFLPTRTFDDCMNDVEFDVTEPCLCIIPGLEGNRNRFRNLCGQLKLNAMVFQPRLDELDETIEQMAKQYARILLEDMNWKNSFYLLGYESGILTALEIAAILENQGLVGKIFCVGLSPEEFKKYLEERLSDFPTDELLQDAILRHILYLMGYSFKKDDSLLLNKLSWPEKINSCVNMLRGKVKHSQQYIRDVVNAAYARIQQARSYTVKKRALKSQIIFMKAESDSEGLKPPESLQLYSKQDIVLYKLNTPLSRAADNFTCAHIINKHLDTNVVEDYEKKNICESFVDNDSIYCMKKI